MNKHVPLRGKFQTFTGEFLVDDFEEFKNDVDITGGCRLCLKEM
ncbi:hypothetical protein J2S00_004060 [Caldalkalibacillus uzonensis]|uniref:Uncharacterized protein n=1 Tax=Caldalkalibacillus uzonensis TaxID=353224 RepID=A0ABU0CYH8_9BACI|nr:hypothetical protein [Caldalkalibacillus uzonensis]